MLNISGHFNLKSDCFYLFSFVLGIWGSVWGINLQTIVKQLRKYQVCCFGKNGEDEEEPVNNEAQRVMIGKKTINSFWEDGLYNS